MLKITPLYRVLFFIILIFCAPPCVLANKNDKSYEFQTNIEYRDNKLASVGKEKINDINTTKEEQFIIELKYIINNLDKDGRILIDKWLKIPSDQWKDIHISQGLRENKFIYNKILEPIDALFSAYIDKDNILFEFNLSSYNKKGFNITYITVEKILGKPSNIKLQTPLDKGTNRKFAIVCEYKINDYLLSLKFTGDYIKAYSYPKFVNTIKRKYYQEITEKENEIKKYKTYQNFTLAQVYINSKTREQNIDISYNLNIKEKNYDKREIYSIPETPIELLLAIKELILHRNEDGKIICEKYLGISQDNWEFVKNKQFVRTEPKANFNYNLLSLDSDNKFIYFDPTMFQDDFYITPQMAINVFGKPTSIKPLHDEHELPSTVYYVYNYRDYSILIYFSEANKGYQDKMFYILRRIYSLFNDEQIKNEFKRRKAIEYHEFYISRSIELWVK